MIDLQVRDQGMGISQADQEQIFEPFYQVENIQTRQVGGTGLGLAIVRTIIAAHNGRIEIESDLGQGTTFHIHLPLVSPAHSAVWERAAGRGTESDAQPRPIPPPVAPRETPLILTIEDDPSTKALIQFTLEDAGYETIGAANGREALQVAAAEQPDLITLDILMPEIDGFHVLDALKKAPETAGIPVCIVSIIEDKAKGYRLGAINYISKPFESEELLTAVQDVFRPQETSENRTILVVEDDPNIVELIDVTLSDGGYQVSVAQDGVVALEKLRAHLPAMVLLDIMIPKIDGYEFIRQAKSDPRTADIPIVVLSVRTLEEDINRALRLGAEKYLTKVRDDEELLRTIPEVVKELVPDEH
jgi:CheY-like chemotaxis protein